MLNIINEVHSYAVNTINIPISVIRLYLFKNFLSESFNLGYLFEAEVMGCLEVNIVLKWLWHYSLSVN
jgi:hypothetical protein